jgi:hypothetical protein
MPAGRDPHTAGTHLCHGLPQPRERLVDGLAHVLLGRALHLLLVDGHGPVVADADAVFGADPVALSAVAGDQRAQGLMQVGEGRGARGFVPAVPAARDAARCMHL